jgi:uncharacterized protein (DUF427 family)
MATVGKSPGFAKNPQYVVDLIDSPRRVKVEVGGEIIADSTGMKLMRETRHLPVYYFPLDDIRMDFMRPSEHTTHCPYKGNASYWSLALGGREIANVMWSYERPYDEIPELAGFAAFYWDLVDHWYEEDEEIFVHPRDPYKRIDTVPSSRAVRVVLGGATVAESARGHFLFETNLPTRYYLPREDVRMDLLHPSETETRCPYKGIARYWSAKIGGETFEDIVWSYADPIPECPKIKDLMCFYNENVEAIYVDGRKVDRPITSWSKK